ncbi:hypothetical protein LSG31_09800 [Fodinisporobacter ferrooxydans]|uniref:Uncharacterized protein n=1 Tax=Fodinisporobacter ferrooxydans TaxID=2901836 RepID=A0ABY4CT53_9BACL|nr:hypothetical protein LSG31_09800 [Alicyclobacillaceae bacterium MYW30-H2]
MNYTINLFGYTIDCLLTIKNEQLTLEIPEKEQKSLKAYLKRVLVRYTELSEDELQSYEKIIYKALEVEKRNGNKLSEPTVKLPYEFSPEVKQHLVESAELRGMSATKLLIELIENKFQTTTNDE